MRRLLYLGRESNPHSRKNWILNPARLPVPPPRLEKGRGAKLRIVWRPQNIFLLLISRFKPSKCILTSSEHPVLIFERNHSRNGTIDNAS